MTVAQLHEKLSALYPKTLSCVWDNDGIMVSADTSAQVKKILLALDGTNEVIEYAKNNGYDTVVTHHPLLFKGVKSVSPDSYSGRRILDAALNGISVLSFHTRADAGEGGVNDSLAEALGLNVIASFGDEDAPTMGRITECEAMTGEALALLVKDKLGCPMVRVTGDLTKTVKKIALCGGAGKDFTRAAIQWGCDAFITGESGYNMAQDATEDGLLTIEAGHYHSEAPLLLPLAKQIEALCGIVPHILDTCAYQVL